MKFARVEDIHPDPEVEICSKLRHPNVVKCPFYEPEDDACEEELCQYQYIENCRCYCEKTKRLLKLGFKRRD